MRMGDPMLSRIFGQRRVLDDVIVFAIVRMEKEAKTDLGEDGMRGYGKDLIRGHLSNEMSGCQELFDGKVRKLHDS